MDFASLPWDSIITIGVICIIVVMLLRDMARPELVLVGALGLLLLGGVVNPYEAFSGFANPALYTIAALYVVAEGVQRTKAIQFIDSLLLSKSNKLLATLPRMMGLTAFLSAFLNNTPIVAMFIPRLQQWCQRVGISASRVMIPLSYAAIIGGMCTLIGTSTNIVVSEYMVQQGFEGMAMFDLAWVGVPAALLVLIYFVTFGYRLLPDHDAGNRDMEHGLRDYLFEFKVPKGSKLHGKSVEDSGLRHLGGAFLAHIQRGEKLVPAAPENYLVAGDVLTFTGKADAIDKLLEVKGLERIVEPVRVDDHLTLPLYEAVIARTSNLVGKTLKESNFRDKYNGVVLGIVRRDESLLGALGQQQLEAGDLLLIEAANGFDKEWNKRWDEFYVVAPLIPGKPKPPTSKAPLALFILLAMVVTFATGIIPPVTAAFVAALLMILTRCVRGRHAREAINISVLVVIGAALGLGKAVEVSGLAASIATTIDQVAMGMSPVIVILLIYLSTNGLTELITNQAAAILMLPIGIAIAQQQGMPIEVIAITVSIAASASFISPFGYQTNLMVMAAGGYRFTDYTKAGAPVSLIVMGTTVTMLYFFFL